MSDTLFDQFPEFVPDGNRGTIQERFAAFHRLNPHVLTALEELTQRWLAKGRRRLGIGMLWETLRWHIAMATSDPNSDYKLNDHMRSRYVRLMVERHPEWKDVFELRKLRAS